MTVGRLRAKLFIFLGVVVVLVGATLASGSQPILGLDLQGGISVVLEPIGNPKSGSIDVAIDLIRERIDGIGVSEPEITRQGGNIVCDLPGVENRAQARNYCKRAAELRFRPVLAQLPLEEKVTPTTTAPGSTTTTADPSASTTTTVPATQSEDAAAQAVIATCDGAAISALDRIPTTRRADDKRDQCVVLPLRAGSEEASQYRLLLGPTELTGDDVASAKRELQTGYVVLMTLTSDGLDKFNELASSSYGQASPQNRVAIVLDGEVQSDPAFQSPTFDGPVQISGDFSGSDASDLARLIRYGSLPVQLRELSVQEVSPTLGKDQLRAGIIAGVIGLILVSIYMIVYYRILGVVVVIGTLISAALLLVVITSFVGDWISEFLGGSGRPVLTLAGVTGLIVSIGVTVDSYVVYFERLKDEVRAGRSVRASADRGFARSFRTIIAADLVSFIGALVLFLVAVGSVKGFAFFLGLSTALDVLVAYFFMHPLVSLMSRRSSLVRMRPFGIASGLDAPEAVS